MAESLVARYGLISGGWNPMTGALLAQYVRWPKSTLLRCTTYGARGSSEVGSVGQPPSLGGPAKANRSIPFHR